MNRALEPISDARAAGASLASKLQSSIRGEVRFDKLSRTIYATDASIYEVIPLGVVHPRDANDVAAVVNVCRAVGASVVARGAGTGLAGGALGTGVQLDLSRHMNRIGHLDPTAATVEVEPGVVLDELNAHLRPHGLLFAPDVATSSRATIGGMVANNSCGAHSIVYGRTVDHVAELAVVLADGRVATFSDTQAEPTAEASPQASRAEEIEGRLGQIRDNCFDEIERRFPKILRSNGGYGLDRLGPPSTRARAIKILCGSEGTLGIVVRATLRLTKIPRHSGLVVLHFADLFDALAATPAILRHMPAAVELIDRMIVEAGRRNPAISKRCSFLTGEPAGLLIVEFFDDDASRLAKRMEEMNSDERVTAKTFATSSVLGLEQQKDVWNLRNSGLGLLMSRPGDHQPHAFVEDSAVDPSRLHDYIRRFTAILDSEGVTAGYYAHASVGCIHMRPVLNLKRRGDIDRMRRIADAVSDLALEFGGALTGEHGDGLVRSCWLEKMYGPRILEAFAQVKRLFDPDNVLNPHKIVDPWPMTEHLRFGATFQSNSVKTHLDFTAHGGMAGLAQMCSGLGQCRQRAAGTMCPSYVATGDETHTTRARANALRVALSNRGLLDGLDDPALEDVMDLCLSCKACKTECPTGVDMARLKSEYLAHRNATVGASRQARFVAQLPTLLKLASRWPAMSNLIGRAKITRLALEQRFGLDHRVAFPRLARHTFRSWLHRHRKRTGNRRGPRGPVVYFVDTWTNHFTPQVGIAAVSLLERAGFYVLCPVLSCCGRPAISKGFLAEARLLAESNVLALEELAPPSAPIVGTEPSCILTLVDEYPQLVRGRAAKRIASRTFTIETFLRRVIEDQPQLFVRDRASEPILYHAHCHQKAIVGCEDAVTLLRHALGDRVSELDAGCCGMAGSFGHEKEHYSVARAIGEHQLFPAVRNRGDAAVAISGFSCRQQIEQHTGVSAKHVVEFLAERLA